MYIKYNMIIIFNMFTLQNVIEQTPEMCLAAVKQNGYELQFVKVQTYEIGP